MENVALNYSTGEIRMKFSETVDVTPITLSDPAQIFLADVSGDEFLQLNDAVVTAADGLTITLTLTESKRARAIALSAVPGGVPNTATLDFSPSTLSAEAGDTVEQPNTGAAGFVSATVTDSASLHVIVSTGQYSATGGAVRVDGVEKPAPTNVINGNVLPIVSDFGEGAIRDIAGNLLPQSLNVAVSEAADTIVPFVESAD